MGSKQSFTEFPTIGCDDRHDSPTTLVETAAMDASILKTVLQDKRPWKQIKKSRIENSIHDHFFPDNVGWWHNGEKLSSPCAFNAHHIH
eukprot:m.79542 g.79542  ORF g.79542 m.79542 type:complete len:89 (+) comp16275_c0_seq1:851-1117(+)